MTRPMVTSSNDSLSSRPPKVLFVCVHNSGRSQMAQAFGETLADGSVVFESAGTMPAPQVNPVAAEAMREKGIDLSGRRPRRLTDEMAESADRVFTMGCSIEDACPAVVVAAEDWALDDPAGKDIEDVRRIRDEIEGRVLDLLASYSRVAEASGGEE
jgi:arsenate reductase